MRFFDQRGVSGAFSPPYADAVRVMGRYGLVAVLAAAVSCGKGAPAKQEAADTAAERPAVAGTEGPSEASIAAQVVRLDTSAIRLGGIVVGAAEEMATNQLPVTGTITYDANLVSEIGARIEGRIVALRADLGTPVQRGQVLALLESPDVGQTRVAQRQAAALLKIASENFARETRLAEQGISSRRELLAAESEVRRAEAEYRSASERLRVLGASAGEGSQFAVVAPFTGVVVTRNAGRGEMARPTDTLFIIADLSRLWIELDIFERDLSRVRIGQPVSVTVAAYPNRVFPGRIVYIGEILDPQRRTVRARVSIPNVDRALKPGMFARAGIEVSAGGAGIVVIPQGAVQELGGRHVVFVPGSRPGEFRPVVVEPGEAVDGNRIMIRSGLIRGSPVVISGAFALRSELARKEMGEEP